MGTIPLNNHGDMVSGSNIDSEFVSQKPSEDIANLTDSLWYFTDNL